MQKEPNYQLFLQWFLSNGGKVKKVDFPAKFGVTQYLGVRASEDIRANQVIMAIPKKLIISVSMVEQSQIGQIFSQYSCLSDKDSQETDFNILALYLIWQKKLGKQSFYYPYLQCIELAQTIIDWNDEDIDKIRDPYITVDFVNQLRRQFPQVFNQFQKISKKHPQFFTSEITKEEFDGCYALVMTRCFGWGLPETMMVPFADFMNHNCHGVHHYIFSRKLEEEDHKDYIRKRRQLDLQIFGIDNKSELPLTYQRNHREQFVYDNRQILQKKNIAYDPSQRMNNRLTKKYMQIIQQQLLKNTYDVNIYPSSDSQDNDSQQDQLTSQALKQKFYYKQVMKRANQQIQQSFQEPKPLVNRQFQDGVNFDWWQSDSEHNYFIVTADKALKKGQQIYNSYGRRSNRFLLIWYGFTHMDNKYDSVVFRFWSEEAYQKTGRLILAKMLTERDWREQLRLGNDRFSYESVTDEYRLKKQRVSYGLMAYLRLRLIRKDKIFQDLHRKKLLSLHKVENLDLQRQMLNDYETVLKALVAQYDPFKERQPISIGHRNYFVSLLLQSNRQILQTHIKSIYILKGVVDNLKNGKSLLQAYHETYLEQQETNKQVKMQNRKPIIDYFKLLAKNGKFQPSK